jgi:1-acyl-sn-glycerol-3-phosphate acyltransferase
MIELPKPSKFLLRWFTRYVRFYLRRNFHGIHLLLSGSLEQVAGRPLLVCLNHPSWWDPLIALYISQRFFPEREHWAPIADAGLNKYRFFRRLGFFGIDPNTRAGAQRFLRIGREALARPNTALWVTPQGQFRDVRERPVSIQSGVGHLAQASRKFAMLPIALEYAFWNERYPEAFAAIGTPVSIDDGASRSVRQWTDAFALALERTQELLARAVLARDRRAFEALLEGNAGIGGIYDAWRSLKARAKGERFHAEHGRI